MSTVALALRQLRYENKVFWRNPQAAVFTFFLPLMFLVIFNTIFGNDEIEIPGGTASTSTFYVPGIVGLSVISACYTNLGISISFNRDQGILKRIRGTPLPMAAFLFGKIASSTFIAIILVAIITLAGTVFYGVDVPTHTMPAFILTFIVGAAIFSSLGLAISGLVPNASAAPAVVNASILPLYFISDVFIPLTAAPKWIETFASVFPVLHFSRALQTSFSPFTTGSGFEFADLAIMAVWGVVGIIVTTRLFSWEPRT